MSEKVAKQWLVGAAYVFCTQCYANGHSANGISKIVYRESFTQFYPLTNTTILFAGITMFAEAGKLWIPAAVA